MSDEKHVWHVGDLCTCVYMNMGEGIVYRVIDIDKNKWGRESLTICPVLGILADITRRRPRTHRSNYMQPLSLVDMASTYAKFGNFIADEAKKRAE